MSSDVVGYGKPPKHSRFKPGQSGNPRGRPKGKVPLSQLIQKHLDAKVAVTVGGLQQSITRREALIIGFIGDALKGKDKVRKQLLDLLLIFEAQQVIDAPADLSGAEDDAVIQSLLQRYGIPKEVKSTAPPKAFRPAKAIKIKTSKPEEAQS